MISQLFLPPYLPLNSLRRRLNSSPVRRVRRVRRVLRRAEADDRLVLVAVPRPMIGVSIKEGDWPKMVGL